MRPMGLRVVLFFLAAGLPGLPDHWNYACAESTSLSVLTTSIQPSPSTQPPPSSLPSLTSSPSPAASPPALSLTSSPSPAASLSALSLTSSPSPAASPPALSLTSSPSPAASPPALSLTSSPSPAASPPANDACSILPTPDPEDECSLGDVACPAGEAAPQAIPAGTFFIKAGIQCEGDVVSWHSCFFFGPNRLQPFLVATVYRPVNDTLVRFSIERLDMTEQNGTDLYGCHNEPEAVPIPIEPGDMIAVSVFATCLQQQQRCPVSPFSESAPNVSLLYLPTSRVPMDTIALSSLQPTQLGLNFKASISASPTKTATPTATPTSLSTRIVIIVVVVMGVVLFVLLVASLFLVLCIHTHRYNKHLLLPVDTEVDDMQPSGDYHLLQREDNTAARDLDWNPSSELLLNDSDRQQSGRSRDSEKTRAASLPNHYSVRRARGFEGSFILKTYHKQEVLKVEPPLSEEDLGYHVVAGTDPEQSTFWTPATKEEELREQLKELRVGQIQSQALNLSDHLGSGQFGTVSKGVWHSPSGDVEVAVKSLQASSSEEERVKFLQEAAIMGQFKHPNIITIFGVSLDDPVMIVCELMQKGDLIQHLHDVRPSSGSTTPPELPAILLSFCRQVAAGMSYLSHKGFIHRDLAARNILLSQDCVCKIADFGLSRDLQDEDFYTSRGGKVPVKWTAPEALSFRQYSTASDVWSYGILLYEIWSLGEKPYKDLSHLEVLRKLTSGFRMAPPTGCPRSLYELMIQCWHPRPEARPMFAEILLALQKPDFKLLHWSSEDVCTVGEEARTLGNTSETETDLYKELQDIYADPT